MHLRDRLKINATLIERENGSDFEDFSAADVPPHLCEEKSSIDESIFPSRSVAVIFRRPLILCGLPRSGKTTIGKHLAARLQYPFLDTDTLIEETHLKHTGSRLTCRQIYKQEGELFFRELEKNQILNLNPPSQTVIALGGGALENLTSLKHLKQIGHIIYLKAPIELLWERLKNDTPAFLDSSTPKSSFQRLATRRSPLYEKSADMIIDTSNLNAQQVIECILVQSLLIKSR